MENEFLGRKEDLLEVEVKKGKAKKIKDVLVEEGEQAKVRDLKRPGRLPRLTDARHGQ